MEDLIKPITLEIDRSLWAKFKKRVMRGTRLNDAVVRLISTFVYEDKFNIDLEDMNEMETKRD